MLLEAYFCSVWDTFQVSKECQDTKVMVNKEEEPLGYLWTPKFCFYDEFFSRIFGVPHWKVREGERPPFPIRACLDYENKEIE